MNPQEDNKEITEEQLAQSLNTDDNIAGTRTLNDELEEDGSDAAMKSELADAKDKYIRLVAEFDNFRKRNAREYREMAQTANRETMNALLDVVDDTERAQKMLETATDVDAIKEGVSLVFNKLRNVLQQKGLKTMDAQGQEFDTELHEAITEIPAPTPDLIGKVIDVVQPGYYLNEKLIRHAKVVVGK